MSIQSEINRLDQNIQDSLSAVALKGVEVPESANSNDLPGLINEIPTNSNFIVTCTADFLFHTLNDVSHSYSDIVQAYEQGKHIILNADLSGLQGVTNGKGTLPLVVISNEAGAYFSTIIWMNSAFNINAGIKADGSTYLTMIPLQEQIAVVSSEDAVEEGKITIVV